MSTSPFRAGTQKIQGTARLVVCLSVWGNGPNGPNLSENDMEICAGPGSLSDSTPLFSSGTQYFITEMRLT